MFFSFKISFKMPRNNKLHFRSFPHPKVCANCCLSSPPGKLFWVITCACGCGADVTCCQPCVKEHNGLSRGNSCFQCKMLKYSKRM